MSVQKIKNVCPACHGYICDVCGGCISCGECSCHHLNADEIQYIKNIILNKQQHAQNILNDPDSVKMGTDLNIWINHKDTCSRIINKLDAMIVG